jgi:uncharacterized membrane protein
MDFGREAQIKDPVALASTPQPGVETEAVSSERLLPASWLLLFGLTSLYAMLICLQIGRHLWFDELLTFDIARVHSIERLLHLVRKWDLNPPTLHLLAHYSMKFFGEGALAVRLPSVIAFYAGSVLLFYYTARKLGTAYAVIPVLILWYGPTFWYATEARPYALLYFWFCFLLVCWHLRVSAERPTLGLWGAGIASAGLISTHVFGFFSLFPFLGAEMVRDFRQKKIDWPMWVALVLPTVGMLGYIPLYEGYQSITFYPAAFQASYHQIVLF